MKALIAVKSTERRDALYALLESLGIDVIHQASDAETSRRTVNEQEPALILTDFNLSSAVPAANPAAIIVLVADRVEAAQARAAGATHVFIEGTPVSQIVDAINGLMNLNNRQE